MSNSALVGLISRSLRETRARRRKDDDEYEGKRAETMYALCGCGGIDLKQVSAGSRDGCQ
jgi:hypothetical protein